MATLRPKLAAIVITDSAVIGQDEHGRRHQLNFDRWGRLLLGRFHGHCDPVSAPEPCRPSARDATEVETRAAMSNGGWPANKLDELEFDN